MASAEYLLAFVLSSILCAIAVKQRRKTCGLPFPPGPKPRFLVGNLFDMPTGLPWITYTEWGKQYGDVVHAQVFGSHILILNSLKAATELLEKRAIIYSDRPTLPMIPLTGGDFSLVAMPYADKWRQHKRLFHQYFRREVIATYRPIQLEKTQDLLRGLLSDPADFVAHTKTLAAAIVMSTIYGYDIDSMNDRFVYLAEEGVRRLGASTLPGAFAVNTLPFLRHFPSWFPGCGFHRFARDTSELIDEMKDAPFQFVRQNMRDRTGRSSVLSELLDHNDTQHNGSTEREEMIKNVTAVAYAAAADTTAATLVAFIMAMAMNPEVVQKAQNEIGTVVGVGLLPGFEHRSALPYCEAVFREVFRWKPIVPLAVPHATSEDDVYQGYFIPKGTIVLPNTWAMVQDESLYGPQPEKFNPERFLNADGQLSANDHILGFGFGRRICLGRHAADATVWATIVSVLSTFDIARAKDENGKAIGIEPAFFSGLISHPKPFKCDITPRNHDARRLIENMSDI